LDNVTHSLVGLNLAHAFFKRRFPEAVPTLLLSSNLPDIDGAVLFSSNPLAVTWRRTFGHSVLLLPLWALALAWLLRRHYRSSSLIALWLLCLLGAYTHIFFDLINSFGVVVFWPFSAWRPELAMVFIIDLFMLALLVFPYPFRFGKHGRLRMARACRWSSGLVAGYLAFCAVNRAYAKWKLDHSFGGAEASFSYVFPEPLGPHRWRCLVRREDHSYREFLFHTLSDRAEPPLDVPSFPNEPAVLNARASPAGRRLDWFFKAPVWRPEPGGIRVYDLRFGSLVLKRRGAFEYTLTPDGRVL
jgi:membrane-bound metal-dependent hydrolase YbcI (DUF457 family)